MQELEGQGVDARLAEGAPLDGGSTREQLEVEASPLTRWTSDGSMMEELLRTFTPGTPAVVAAAAVSQAQASSSLAKDMSISSALMALIAQQQEETAAAERQHEAAAPQGGSAAMRDTVRLPTMEPGMQDASAHPRPRPVWLNAAAQQWPAAQPATGAAMAAVPQTAACAISSPHPPFLAQEGPSARVLPGEASDRSSLTLRPVQQQQQQQGMVRGYRCSRGPAVQQHASSVTTPNMAPAATLLRGEQAPPAAPELAAPEGADQGLGWLPDDVHDVPQPGSSACSKLALAGNAYMHPISAPRLGCSLQQQQHMGVAQPGPPSASVHDLGSRVLHGVAGHAGRAASAPAERMLPGCGEACTSGSALRGPEPAGSRPTALHTFSAVPSVPGSQLAAHYLQEAAHQLQGLQHAPVLARIHAVPRPASQPLSAIASAAAAPAPGAEPPAVLTAGITMGGWLVPDACTHGGQPKSVLQPGQCPSLPPAEPLEAQPIRGKRERSMAPQRLPAGPKRSALGPLLARGDKYDGYISDLSRGSDDSGGMARPPSAAGFLDEREAKRQLRKEKNRASAAASRARREAYTASLEEEVARLKEGQSWLERQVDNPRECVAAPVPARAPLRHLSI